MATSTLPITTIVTVSVESPQAGFSVPQVNNLCILSREVPINPVPAQGYFIYQNSTQVGLDWGTGSETFTQAQNIFAQRPNILSGGGQLIVYQMTGLITTITQAIAAVESLIFAGAYVWSGYAPSNGEIIAGAAEAQSVNKMLGVSSFLTSDLTGSGLFATLANDDDSDAIMFLYTQAGSALGARTAMAALMSKGMSTDFEGNATTSTLNLKDLANVTGDSGITPTIQSTCASLGVNTYPNIQNVPKVISSGGAGSNFFDTVYNTEWFANAIQIAYLNVLAETDTKIPQTEQGMAVLRAAVTAVCRQAVTNGFLAPGTWNGDIPFGNPETFLQNIAQSGFYVYTQPIALQSQSSRAARQATVMQVAGKEAGAVQSGQVIVYLQP
jgi:hypothetical protein